MERINEFINDILDNRGINHDDKEDLRLELLDHILLLKKEYIATGLDEDKATELALQNFGDINTIGNGIKRTLPSRNKYKEFTLREISKIILVMLLGYIITVVYAISFQEMNLGSLTYYISITLSPIIINFIYVNFKLGSKMIRIKNMIKSLLVFLLVERMLFLMVYAIQIIIHKGSDRIDLFTLLNFKYIAIYLCVGIVFVVLTSLISDKVVVKIRNPYNSKLKTNILLTSSLIFMILYYLFPNRWYILCSLIEKILGSEIIYVNKNILFLTINHEMFIPNIGLIVLIIMGINLFRQVYRKGIESLT